MTVSGGKLTTFRLIALDVLKVCQKVLALDESATQDNDSYSSQVFSNQTPTNPKFTTLPKPLQQRLQGFYGRQLDALLELAHDDELTYVTDSNTIWAEIRFAVRFEQVIHLDDLLLRRTRLGLILPHGAMTPLISDRLKQICQQELGWDEQKWQQEVERYIQLWQRYYHLPAA